MDFLPQGYFNQFNREYKRNQKIMIDLNNKMDYNGLYAYFQKLKEDIVNDLIDKGVGESIINPTNIIRGWIES